MHHKKFPSIRHSLTFTGILAAVLCIGGPTSAQNAPAGKCPPPARTDNVKDTYGSKIVTDPYRWLEDQNSPETRAWITAEQVCTAAALNAIPGRDTLKTRVAQLLQTDDYTSPTERGGRYFFMKRLANQDLSVLYMRTSIDGPDELLLDPHPWSPDHSLVIYMAGVSRNGKYVYYAKHKGGKSAATLHVFDVDAKKDLPDSFPEDVYGFGETASTVDSTGFYYIIQNEQPRILFHKIGTDVSKDPVVFPQSQSLTKDKILYPDLSQDGKYMLITVSFGTGSEKTEIYLLNLETKAVTTIVNDVTAPFHGSFGGNTIYIMTNWNAPNSRVFAADVSAPSRDHWREFIPETDARLSAFSAGAGKLFVEYARNASTEARVFNADGTSAGIVSLPVLGSAGGFRGRWDSPDVFFSFLSYNYPPAIWRYNTQFSKSAPWVSSKPPFNSNDFEVKQVWYQSKDKTKIPMFLFYKKGLKQDGMRPVLLTGYGGFDVIEGPSYNPEFIVWAEKGGVVASANMRGGGEFGEAWHKAGMLGNKQNVFDDFAAAGEYLIAQKYTNKSKLSIEGASNGGLLVAASLVQHPDLFRAVACAVPLTDMLRYHKFFHGSWWVPEYGNADNPDQFGFLYAYSPYQHVVKGTKYPAVLFSTGDSDDHVAPLHARKMTAAVQAATTSGHPVLLLYDTLGGHGGVPSISKRIDEQTNTLAFLFWQLGVSLN